MKNSTPSISSKILRNAFLRKQKSSPSYSQRALARDLGVSPAFVMKFMKGLRPLPLNRISAVARILDLDSSEKMEIIHSLVAKSLKSDEAKYYLNSLVMNPPKASTRRYDRRGKTDFKIFEKWYSVVILDLMTCSNFKNDSVWISKRLGITPKEVEECLGHLEREKYIEWVGNRYVKKNKDILFSTGHTNIQIRNFHREMIRKAFAELSLEASEDVHRRMINSFTVAAVPEKVDLLKSMILEFMSEASKFLSDGICTEVYQLNVQLFPLTKENKNG